MGAQEMRDTVGALGVGPVALRPAAISTVRTKQGLLVMLGVGPVALRLATKHMGTTGVGPVTLRLVDKVQPQSRTGQKVLSARKEKIVMV